jgi:flagellar hook-length control protein FliK
MNSTPNVSAIVEIKGGKAAGKALLPGALTLPGADLVSFEQLLGDSAAQLVTEAADAVVALDSAPQEQQAQPDIALAPDLLALGGAVVPAADAPAPTSMLQVWQAWLSNTASAPAAAAQPEGAADEGVNISAIASEPIARPQGREANAPATVRENSDSRAQAALPSDAVKEEFALPSATLAGSTPGTPERSAVTEIELAAASKDVQAPLSVTQPDTRKPNTPQIQVVSMAVPLRAPEWSNAFSEQIVLLVDDGGGRAELRLNPAELGPIDVTLNVQDDRVRASFTIHHAATLDAVQAALPKLEQMMAERGMQLDSVSVETNERRQEQNSQQARSGNDTGGQARREGDKQNNTQSNQRIVKRNGLVDTFA